ncbi:MAG TPA: acyl-CoA reductase, partial [Polyangiaceae bacterium]
MSRASDVRKFLAAASHVARDPAIVEPLALSTGLSREGVELALARHVETSASDEQIASLLAYAGRTDHVHVVLSANVFVAAVRAIAIALAASDHVTIKPSRREPVFAKALVDALADPRVTIGEGDGASEIHVYGRDETIAEVRRAHPGVRVRGHGAGMGIALVTRDFEEGARALAEDVIPFDQRGCSSPRVAYVRGDAAAFGRLLFEALEARGREVPRGKLDEAEEAARWCDTIAYAGTLHRGATCAVGVADVRAIPPTGRHVLVRPFPPTLGDDARFVVAVG